VLCQFRFHCVCPPPPESRLFPYTTLFRSKALESGNTKELYNTASATCWNVKNPSGHADDDAETYINSAVLTVDKTVAQYEYEIRSEEHTSELQSRFDLVCRLLLEKKKT